MVGETQLVLWHSVEGENLSKNLIKRRDTELKRSTGKMVDAYRCPNCGYVELSCPA